MKEIHKYKFNLDGVFDKVKALAKDSIFYTNEINFYQRILNPYNGREYIREGELGKINQFFETSFGFDDDNPEVEYPMVWNIQKAEDLIREKGLIPIRYSVASYKNDFQDTYIDKRKALNAKFNKKPIIFVKWMDRDILIDGNHRYYNALKRGEKYISAYVLSVEESLECMQTEVFRLFFKIHHNMMEIVKRLTSPSRQKPFFSDNYGEGQLYMLHNTLRGYLGAKFLLWLQG